MTVLFLLLAIAFAVLLDHFSSKDPFRGIKHELILSKGLVEPDEKFSITTEITNTRKLPVLFLRISENLPLHIKVEDSPGVSFSERQYLADEKVITAEQTMYIMPRQKVTRVVNAAMPARGRYVFTGGQLRVGDLLGFSDMTKDLGAFRDIVVLPRRIEAPETDTAFGSYLGDISVKRFILSDPILTIGFREYTGREPQKDISWPRSLRENKLMVKQYDYTSEMTATVLLNIYKAKPEDIERCYCLARHICEELEEKRISYSFITNACAANSAGIWSYMSDGLGESHLRSILEGLGRATHESMFSFDRLMTAASKQLDTQRAYILVTPRLSSDQLMALRRTEARLGARMFLVEADIVSEEEAA